MDEIKIPDIPNLGAWTSVVALLFLFLGWWAKYGMDIWERWRKRKMEDAFDVAKLDLMEDEQLKDGFKFAIKKQDRQITKLERQCEHIQLMYSNCMEEHARAETTIGFMTKEIKELQEDAKRKESKIDSYRSELRRYQGDPRPSPPPISIFPKNDDQS